MRRDRPSGRTSTFSSLRTTNYRAYFIGQAISLVGTWMQSVAQSWLVLELTGSATQVGVLVALQTLPLLFLAPYGGLIADRVDKRRLLIATQTSMGALALLLGMLTVTDVVTLWMVDGIALLLGVVNAFDNPARQSFVVEMVGPADLRNAVSLNSVLVNAARAVGPAVAGILIAVVGTGACFLLNALSFVAAIVALTVMDPAKLTPATPAVRAKGQLRAGLAYVRSTPGLLFPLLMMGIVGTLAYEFSVSLPVLARQTLHGDAATYGFITAAIGVGAVGGGLLLAGRAVSGLRPLVAAAVAFGIAILAAAVAPTFRAELAVLTIVGAGSVAFLATGNSTLQLGSLPQMRGRVMALWTVAFLGSTPIGGPIIGIVAQRFGGRAALAVGGFATLAAAALGAFGERRMRRAARQAPAEGSG